MNIRAKLFFTSMSLFFLVEYCITCLFPLYLSNHLKLSITSIGLFVGIFSLSAIFSKFFSGHLADKYGRRRVILIGIFVCLIAIDAYLHTPTLWLILIVRGLQGIGSGLVRAINLPLALELFDHEKKSKTIGIMSMTLVVPMVLASMINSYIFDKISTEQILQYSALPSGNRWMNLLLLVNCMCSFLPFHKNSHSKTLRYFKVAISK